MRKIPRMGGMRNIPRTGGMRKHPKTMELLLWEGFLPPPPCLGRCPEPPTQPSWPRSAVPEILAALSSPGGHMAGWSPRPCPRTCGQVEDVVAPAVARSHLMHADFLVAVLVVEEGAPGRPQRLHPLLHLGVAVCNLEGLAGRVLAGGDALRGQRGQKAQSEAEDGLGTPKGAVPALSWECCHCCHCVRCHQGCDLFQPPLIASPLPFPLPHLARFDLRGGAAVAFEARCAEHAVDVPEGINTHGRAPPARGQPQGQGDTSHPCPALQRKDSGQEPSPGVGEEPVDFGVAPVARRDDEDVLQPVEVALGDGIHADQGGLEERGPLGGREGAGASLVLLGDRDSRGWIPETWGIWDFCAF